MNRQPQSPPELPGLVFLELLGSGGFSDVYAYRQQGLNREVAVKVMLGGLGPDLARQFEIEAQTMAKLSLHYHVVPVHAAGIAPDGRSYLVMQLCDRRSLAARIRRPLQVGRALEIAIQIAGAIETAHRLGIVHRDIKPANILFISNQRPALTDFGIAATMASGDGVNAFSIPWAPPEQIDGHAAGPGADIYGLAATTYAMLTGRSPFEVTGGPNDPYSVAQRVRHHPVQRTGRADVPDSLERVLAVALAKQPGQRYAKAIEFARALQGVQAELGLPITRIDVLADTDDDWEDQEGEDSGTRLTSFAVLDPEIGPGGETQAGGLTWASGPAPGPAPPVPPTPSWLSNRPTPGAPTPRPAAGVQQHGSGSAPAREVHFTGAEVPEARPVPVIPESAPPKRRSPARAIAVVGATVLVLAGAVAAGVAMSARTPGATTENTAPTTAVRPADPVGRIVPRPTGAKAVQEGTEVVVTWLNPQPEEGDYFLYRVAVPGREQFSERTEATSVRVPAEPGRTCVEIVLARANGRDSEPTVACTEG
ncbi:MAG TPA: serine/threonine protein kinase [Propionibacterium sp.]|nr:serine/threonine protein kinase [Propionibacterium sp.]